MPSTLEMRSKDALPVYGITKKKSGQGISVELVWRVHKVIDKPNYQTWLATANAT
jgi:hypothetical protein